MGVKIQNATPPAVFSLSNKLFLRVPYDSPRKTYL